MSRRRILLELEVRKGRSLEPVVDAVSAAARWKGARLRVRQNPVGYTKAQAAQLAREVCAPFDPANAVRPHMTKGKGPARGNRG